MELTNATRGFVFFGIGIHQDFPAENMKKLMLRPLLKQLHEHHRKLNSTRVNPRVLWAATHAPGLLKTARVVEQSAASVQRYNDEIGKFLQEWDVPVFDTYHMTDGVMAFDGAHYGLGVNRVKVRILMQYLLDLTLKKLW
jgi:hypothetical protein